MHSRSAKTAEFLAFSGRIGDHQDKVLVGEYGGGHLAASVLALAGAPFGRVRSFETADAELGVSPHDGSPLPAPRSVLATALAAGGAAAWALLERP